MQLYAEKANKALKINEAEKDTMIRQGFDIVSVDDKGTKTFVANGVGKTVPIDELDKANARIAALEKELAKLRKPAKDSEKEPEKEAKE